MIRSSIRVGSAADLITKVLANPDSLKKSLDKLQAQEKKARSASKALLEAKSLSKYKEEVHKECEAAAKVVLEAQEKAAEILSSAKKKASAMLQEVEDREAAANAVRALAVESLDKNTRQGKQTTKLLEEAKKASEKAAEQKARYELLKETYEQKLSSLKEKFAGLV